MVFQTGHTLSRKKWIKVKCLNCDKEYEVRPSHFKTRKRFYCNLKCRNKHWIGENNPMFGKKQSDKCKKIVSENGKKLIGSKNSMFGKTKDLSGKNYFYEDLGHRCRSSWETNFARVLKHKNTKYVYEKTTFKLKNGDSYTPDFYLVNENKYIEVKGYTREKFLDKLKRFKKEYPKIKIEIFGEKEYKKLKQQYKNKINWETSTKAPSNIKFKEVGISKITKSTYTPKNVYNISVEDDESFVANGILTHNTKPHEITAKNKKALSFKAGGKNIVVKSVMHPGTRPNPFVRDTIFRKLPEIITEELNR